MKTLLEKVQIIEDEAADIIARAEQSGKTKLETIQEREEDIMEDIRKRAEKRAAEIIQEHVREADQEINSIKQEGKHAVEMVHAAAKKNRQNAVARAHQLFKRVYLKSNS